ncbi:MAG: thioredoxin family protein [Christiangramia sp.]|uniref:TlpA family protein disulfide reductase n=1 Tax=Christiangramia sp. TaxID=1931228 RepID=UPI0032421FCE
MIRTIFLFAAIALSCVNTQKSNLSNEKPKEESSVQSDILIGLFHKEDLQAKPYAGWFNPRYEKFTPENEALETIKENINDYQIKLFMGTWCGDSKRETPKMLKLLDEAGYNYDNLEMFAVDYDKTTPDQLEEKYDIHHVPTIIFYKDGKEVNRFVEYAQGASLEEDIAKIVSGEEYHDSYSD